MEMDRIARVCLTQCDNRGEKSQSKDVCVIDGHAPVGITFNDGDSVKPFRLSDR